MAITPYIEAPNIRITEQPVSGGIDISSYEHLVQGINVKNNKLKLRTKGVLPKLGAGTDDHTIEENNFGQPLGHEKGTSFEDEQKIYPVQYVQNPGQFDKSLINEGLDINGALEPFDIRDVASFSVYGTLVHSVKGHLQDGNIDKFNSSDSITSLIPLPQISASVVVPFDDNGSHIGSNIQYSVILDGDRSDLRSAIPFFDDAGIDENRLVSSPGTSLSMNEAILAMTGAIDDTFIPSNYKSAYAGFVYNNNNAGTDSLSFGGFLYVPDGGSSGIENTSWASLWGTTWAYQSSVETDPGTKIKLLPRQKIREKDSISTYPTIARTGDTRDGVFSIKFNDNETLLFTENPVNTPTLLRTDAIYFDNYLSTSINISSGFVKKGVSDRFVTMSQQYQSLTPFNEAFRPEQSMTGSFFLTGTYPSVALGFSEKLSSKTQINYELPIASRTQLLANTASVLYFNKELGRFEIVNQDDLTDPGNAVFTFAGPRYYGAYDAKLFGPFGNNITSGNLTSYINVGPLTMIEAMLSRTGSVLNLPGYAMTSSNYFDLNINHPFLLESICIELPISFSIGWSQDRTTFGYDGTALDYGGPAVTVSLIRQDANNYRELIVSGTLIPSGDNYFDVFAPEPINPGQQYRSPQGFLAFGTPSTVVSGDGGVQKVLLSMKPSVANGMFVFSGNEHLNNSSILQFNNFGRGAKNKISGRSIFGGEFIIPDIDDFPDAETRLASMGITSSLGSRTYLFMFEANRYSPYLLLPDDKITLCISKHRSIATDPQTSFSVLSSSHEISIETGSLNITMYGSLIRENKVFHDSLNQPLTTNAIHEALHFDNPVVDQYDVESAESNMGTYTDNIVDTIDGLGVEGGWILVEEVVTESDILNRGVKGSALGNHSATGITGSFLRGVRLTGQERYYDSAPPDSLGVIQRGGGTIVGSTRIDSDGNLYYNTVEMVTFVQFGPGQAMSGTTIDKTWPRAYPFEPFYSGINRQKTTLEDTCGQNSVSPYPLSVLFAVPHESGDVGQILEISGSLYGRKFTPAFTAMRDTHADNVSPYMNKNRLARAQEVSTHVKFAADRAMYGFGDGIVTGSDADDSHIHMPKFTTILTETPLSASEVEMYVYRDCEIRGWKYGLISALPFNSTAVFRRDHHGYVRDMLEQRQDSRFFKGSSATTSPVVCKFTTIDPNLSFSSNLSAYATSSLPYFDGESKNRGELPEVEFVAGG